ncbi:MAG: hypothetical protein J6331_02320 [Lentisphaeria bacterium]|nr:hypothetical protein [Lentisphaeria bacterium]
MSILPEKTSCGGEKTKTCRGKRFLCAVFFLLLTVFALLALQVKYKSGRGGFSSSGGRGTIGSFDPGKVRKIQLSWMDNKVTLLLGRDNFWHIAEREMAFASASRIGDLLHSLASLRVLKQLEDPSPEVLEKLNLTEKGNSKGVRPGVLAVLKDGTGKELFRILLGRGHYPPASGDSAGSVQPKGRYVLLDGKVFLAARLFENCVPLPQVFVEPLAIRNMNTALLVMRTALPEKEKKNDPDKVLAPVWAAVRQRANQPFRTVFPEKTLLDMRKFSALSETLARQLTLDILPSRDPASVPLTSMVTVQLSDGFSYRLGISVQGKEELLLPQVAFDAGKVRRLPGESDKHFQAKIAGAKLRFESEKRYYNGKVFRMVPGTAEKLSAPPFLGKNAGEKRGASGAGKVPGNAGRGTKKGKRN